MINILYEDNHILVAYKPYGILSQSDGSNSLDMLTILKDYIKNKYNKIGNVYLGLVHRLDRNTEGIMVFARTSKAAKRLQEAMKDNNFNKNYIAVVEGKLGNKKGELINYLNKDEKYKKAYLDNNGKYACLEYEVINEAIVNNIEVTYVNILLKTGRFHQIRCQFANLNHPLYSDYKYGSKYMQNAAFLQAYQLEFKHPTKEEVLSFSHIDKSENFSKLEF